MDNKFFEFVRTYWSDIEAFFEALIAFVKAIFGLANEGESSEE